MRGKRRIVENIRKTAILNVNYEEAIAMVSIEEKIQALVDEFYTEWQKDDKKDKWDVLEGFSEAHQIAVTFGNFNYQVENGGLSQWVYNGYFHDDAEKFIEYLEVGAELDERCRTILDRVYKIDQYAQEMDSDRYGNYHDPGEDGESGFIGDLINCDAFDSWYYKNCDKDDWWEVVGGVIEKVTGLELAQAGQDDRSGEEAAPINPPLRVYIENVHDDRIGGFTMPLPAKPEMFQGFFEGAEITGWQDIEIVELYSDIDGLGKILTESIKKTMSPDTLDELNYLAARIQDLHRDEHGYGIFAAAVEAKRHSGDATELINLTFTENINRFDCWPVFSEKEYGDILVNQFLPDEHIEAFVRLRDSENPDDRALAAHIEKLEAHVDVKAFGRTVVKEQDGIFTEHGYLIGGDGLENYYKGTQDIPPEHRIFTKPDETVRQPMKLDGVDIAATILKLHAISGGDNMFHAPDNLRTLFDCQDRNYILLIDSSDVCLYPVARAYMRGTEAAAFISLGSKASEEGADFSAFAVRVLNRDENGATGDLIELNAKALDANVSRHAVAPDRIDVVYSNGASKSYDLWDWAELPQYARDDIREYTTHFPEGSLVEAERRYTSFVGANETVSMADSFDAHLPALNAAYMAAAENPQPGMIRINNEAAKEMLARGDADIYRMMPGGAEKLAPIEATRPASFESNRDLAIKREDIAGLDKWAERAVKNIQRQAERAERRQDKNKGEEL